MARASPALGTFLFSMPLAEPAIVHHAMIAFLALGHDLLAGIGVAVWPRTAGSGGRWADGGG